jgi:hypothetical protein
MRRARPSRVSLFAAGHEFTRRWVCFDLPLPILLYRRRVSLAYLHIRQNPRSPSRHHVGSQPGRSNREGIEFFVVSAEQQFRVVAELTVETEK